MNDDIIKKLVNKVDNIKSNLLITDSNNVELLNQISFYINKLNTLLLDNNNNTNYYTITNDINNYNIDNEIYNIYLPYILYTQLILQNK